MADKKKHHYVPSSYLKRFSHDGVNVIAHLSDNGIKQIPFRHQNQKDYLYSLGQVFGDKHNLFEDFLGKTVEDPFNEDMTKTIDVGVVPTNEKLVSIVYFSIIQSCRPLVYKNDFEENFKKLGLIQDGNPILTYGFLVMSMINKFWEKIKTCTVEILIANEGRQFVTSDNPATLWVPINGLSTFVPLTQRFLYDSDPDLELLMPLSPKFLLKVYLNRSRPVDPIVWDSNTRLSVDSETTNFNSRVIAAQHRCVYCKDLTELDRLGFR